MENTKLKDSNTNKDLTKIKGCYGFIEGKDTAREYFIAQNAILKGFVYMGQYSILERNAEITNALIGRLCHIERNVRVGAPFIHKHLILTHPIVHRNVEGYFPENEILKTRPKRFFYENTPLTYIGDGVKIGENAILSSGVKIGNGAIILPNSYVNQDVPEYAIAGGVPANVLEMRFDNITCQKLKNLKLESQDFSSDLFKVDSNFGNLSSLDNISRRDQREIKISQFDSAFSSSLREAPNIAIIGPSHIENWIKLIRQGKLRNPEFSLYGLSGLAITSPTFKNFIDFWLSRDRYKKIVINVPDFRMGNSILLQPDEICRFIYKDALSLPSSDVTLKGLLLKELDYYASKYKDRIKFLFWSQYGRQYLNTKQGKYINKKNGTYEHIMSYDELEIRYKNTNIDMSTVKNFDELIVDSSLHPSLAGYKLMEKIILNSFN